MTNGQTFTPALRLPALTASYDRVIAAMTREKTWRGRLLEALAPAEGETIVDLGCGTGTLAIMVARAAPNVTVLGVDPDPEVLALARAKAKASGIEIGLVNALGADRVESLPYGRADKVVTSLVLHQCPIAAKRGILANAHALLRPGGRLFVADFGVQKSWLMRLLFNQVRLLDGYANTGTNKDGAIPLLISQAGFSGLSEDWVLGTPTGSISLWTGTKSPG